MMSFSFLKIFFIFSYSNNYLLLIFFVINSKAFIYLLIIQFVPIISSYFLICFYNNDIHIHLIMIYPYFIHFLNQTLFDDSHQPFLKLQQVNPIQEIFLVSQSDLFLLFFLFSFIFLIKIIFLTHLILHSHVFFHILIYF